MRVSQLGVVIDSSGAKRGAQEATQALQQIGQTATKTGQQVTQASKAVAQSFEEQVRAQQKAQAAANRAANEAARQAREAQEQANARRAQAEQAVRAAERIADAEAKKARAMALAETQAYAMDKALAAAGKGALGTEAGLNALRGSLTATLTPLLGTAGSANVLVSTLGRLTVGSQVMVGAIAGVAALAAAWTAYQSATEFSRKATEDAIKALDELAKKQRQGATGETPQQIALAVKAQTQATKELAQAQRELRALQTSPSYGGAKVGDNTGDQTAAIARTQAKIADLQNKIAAGQREVTRVLNETNAEYSRSVTEQLATVVRAGNATADEQNKLRQRLANLRAELAKQTDAGADPSVRAKLIADIRTITDVYDAQGKAVKKASDETQRWGDYVTKIFADVQRVVDESERAQREATDKRNKALTDGVTAIDQQVAAQKRENDILREKIAATKGAANALDELTVAEAEAKAVAEAVAKLPRGVLLDPETEATIRAQAREWVELNKALKDAEKVKKALDSYDGSNPFTLPTNTAKDAREFAQDIRDAASAASDLASAFGDTGSALAKAIDQTGRLLSAFERLKAAQSAQQAAGGAQQAAGLGATLASAAPVVSFAAAFVGIARSMSDAMRQDAERRNQLQREFAASVQQFAKSVADGGLSTVQKERADLSGQIAEQVAKALAATGAKFTGASPGLFDATAEGLRSLQSSARFTASNTPNGRTAGALQAFADALDDVIKNAEAAEAALRKRQAAEFNAAQQDVQLALLVAQGRSGEAEAMRRQLDLQRQIEEARSRFAGMDGLDEYIAALEAVTAAAAAAADAERKRQGVAFGLDVTARRQTLNGDTRGAMITRQTISNNSALAAAQELVAAGTITAAMFEELKTLLGDEMTAAIAEFDAAVEKAKQDQQDDLAVRALVAQGKSKEAEALRLEIANRNELAGVTDDAVRAQIIYVQGLEAAAIATAEAAAAAQEYADTIADIDRRKIDALKIINPELAAEMEARQVEIDRMKELAAATDDAMRARLLELYALQDQAKETQKLAEQMDNAAKAARELADFSSDLETQWLRATGQTFQASVNELNDWRTSMMKNAAANGLANDPETQRKIQETYDAKYSALIASTMDKAAQDSAAATRDPSVELVTQAISRSINAVEASRLIDIQYSALIQLQNIAANTAEGSNGLRISVVVQGGTFTGTPAESGRQLANQLAPLIDEALGRRVGVSKRIAGSDAL